MWLRSSSKDEKLDRSNDKHWLQILKSRNSLTRLAGRRASAGTEAALCLVNAQESDRRWHTAKPFISQAARKLEKLACLDRDVSSMCFSPALKCSLYSVRITILTTNLGINSMWFVIKIPLKSASLGNGTLEEFSNCSNGNKNKQNPLREVGASLFSHTSGHLHITVLTILRCQLSPRWHQGHANVTEFTWFCKCLIVTTCPVALRMTNQTVHLSFNNEVWWTTVTTTWGWGGGEHMPPYPTQ